MHRGFRGWSVEYSDGTEIYEGQMEWKAVPKQNIVRLTLHFDGRRWDIDGERVYFQKKRVSIIPGVKESLTVESRSIGYYEGNNKVFYTVDEHSGRMKMEVKDLN